jgi:hypothetical protein
MGLSQFDENHSFAQSASIAAAQTTTEVTLYVGAQADGRIDAVLCTNFDVIDHIVRLWTNVGGTHRVIGSTNVPAGSGTAGAKSVDALAGSLPSTVTGIVVPPNANLNISVEVTLTLANTLTALAIGGYV